MSRAPAKNRKQRLSQLRNQELPDKVATGPGRKQEVGREVCGGDTRYHQLRKRPDIKAEGLRPKAPPLKARTRNTVTVRAKKQTPKGTFGVNPFMLASGTAKTNIQGQKAEKRRKINTGPWEPCRGMECAPHLNQACASADDLGVCPPVLTFTGFYRASCWALGT
jgi:hypothetical protein